MLFMGQEILETKPWSDMPSPETLVWWEGLTTDRAMRDHLRCTRDLLRVRRAQLALRGEPINVFHVHNDNRVLPSIAGWRGAGRDVVIVGSLNESTFFGYQLGFPGAGRWLEIFNSDVYDTFVNPAVAGNGGQVTADGPALHGMPASAAIVILRMRFSSSLAMPEIRRWQSRHDTIATRIRVTSPLSRVIRRSGACALRAKEEDLHCRASLTS